MYQFKEAIVKIEDGKGIYYGKQIRTPKEAIEVIASYIKDFDRELVMVINLTTSNRPINYTISSIGANNYAVVSIPSIFKAALLSNAASIIMIHNHPDSDNIPSSADIEETRRVYEASKIMGINLMDHLVIDRKGDSWSIRGSNPEAFGEEVKKDV